MAGLQLPDDRLTLEGDHLITFGSTITNISELTQDDVPRFRNTEISGLDRGRPEEPAMDPRPVTLAGLIVGEVDLEMPTAGSHANPRGGVRANWRAIQTIFQQQFDAETLAAAWTRRNEDGSLETVYADVQVGNWQLTGDFEIEYTYTFELTRFSDWEESS